MSTFLELVNKAKSELGVEGAALVAVTSQTAMAAKLVAWVAKANLYVQNIHTDWNFLWSEFSYNTVLGTSTITVPANLNVWDTETFWIDYATATAKKLDFMQYREFKASLGYGIKTNSTPDTVTIKPNKDIIVDPPTDGVYVITADYWMSPTTLVNAADTSAIPAQFEDIIVAKAKMYFADEEEFPELYAIASKEFDDILVLLEASELPGRERNNLTEAPESTVLPV